jgi:hypothetical protein
MLHTWESCTGAHLHRNIQSRELPDHAAGSPRANSNVCMRICAGGHGSIGFLADTRRLNVAITRAKRSLWVLGHVASLRVHNVWKELLQDAEARGCVVSVGVL